MSTGKNNSSLTKKKLTYAFIDSQNLNLGTSKDIHRNRKLIYRGWKLDYQKFRVYLKNKYKVSKAFLFIGKISGNEKLYKLLKDYGYILVFKPTITTNSGTKGNVDAEIVLHSAKIQYRNYDKAVFISGDGDFYCLYEELEKDRKLSTIIIPNKKSASSLLNRFQRYKAYLIFDKAKVERQKKEIKSGRRAELPLR